MKMILIESRNSICTAGAQTARRTLSSSSSIAALRSWQPFPPKLPHTIEYGLMWCKFGLVTLRFGGNEIVRVHSGFKLLIDCGAEVPVPPTQPTFHMVDCEGFVSPKLGG